MKKIAAIFHGSGGSENSFWIPWLKSELQKNDYDVWAPSIADHDDQPDLDEWVNKIEALSSRRNFDLMVGHSSGVPLILRLLSKDFTSTKAIGVAGYMKPLSSYDLQGLNFEIDSIKRNVKHLTFIHSDNDPWGCDAKNQGEYMRSVLGGTLIVRTGEGHFGSDTYKQPYRVFPLLLSHCLLEED